jgi:hypothetical protein
MTDDALSEIDDDSVRDAFEGTFGREGLRTQVGIGRRPSIVVDGTIWDGVRQVGTFQRRIETEGRDGLGVRQVALYISDPTLQRTGFGTAFQMRCENYYQRLGVRAIRGRAAGQVGFWAMARWGFDWDIPARWAARLVRGRLAHGGISDSELAALEPRLIERGQALRADHLQHAWELAALGELGRRLIVGDWDAIKLLDAGLT